MKPPALAGKTNAWKAVEADLLRLYDIPFSGNGSGHTQDAVALEKEVAARLLRVLRTTPSTHEATNSIYKRLEMEYVEQTAKGKKNIRYDSDAVMRDVEPETLRDPMLMLGTKDRALVLYSALQHVCDNMKTLKKPLAGASGYDCRRYCGRIERITSGKIKYAQP